MKHRIVMMVVCLLAFSLTACTQQEQRIGSIPSGAQDFVSSSVGCHMAIIVEHQGKWHVEIDGRPGPEYDGIVKGDFTFHADGNLKYLAIKNDEFYRITLEP